MSGLSRARVLEGLLQRNYLPAHKSDLTEIPPVLSSLSLTPVVAAKIAANCGCRKGYGYDAVEYRAARFDGVYRSLHIPHPVPYSELALCIADNWSKIGHVATNANSRVKPTNHRDGRLMVMDYDDAVDAARREMRFRSDSRFLAHADVESCFPSLYSHSIPWAVAGFENAKRNMKRKDVWYNKLDSAVMYARRNETKGVPVGPGTSGIVAELVLGKVDEALRNRGFTFLRFVDDYTAYCETEEQAGDFIYSCAEELAKYRLSLNRRKTGVTALPQPMRPEWLHQLSLFSPWRARLTPFDVYNYLDMAVGMSRSHPSGSVLKYAIKALTGRRRSLGATSALADYAVELATYNLSLISLLGPIFEDLEGRGQRFRHAEQVAGLVLASGKARCSDGASWAIYYLRRFGGILPVEHLDSLIAARDCTALTLAYSTGQQDVVDRIVDYAKALALAAGSEYGRYELDSQWLLLYQLYRAGRIRSPYNNEAAFKHMKDAGVTFLT